MAARYLDAYLYVLGAVGGPCKVGWSQNVKRRSQYVENPAGETDIIHIAPIAYRYALYAERYAHWLLRDAHYRNEWFNVEPAAAIDAANKAVALDFKRMGLIPALLDRHTAFRFEAGTMARIDAVLDVDAKEKRAAFIREAVERELKRREKRG
ncbi:hypothetical protein ACVIYH_009068 [Bradyrhizobium diazoefficiens]